MPRGAGGAPYCRTPGRGAPWGSRREAAHRASASASYAQLGHTVEQTNQRTCGRRTTPISAIKEFANTSCKSLLL